MSITGSGILFRYRAGGSAPGLAFTRAGATATRLSNTGLLTTIAANALRTSFFDTNTDGMWETPAAWLEPAGTNIALWCRDHTNGAWTKTTMTTALTQTGIDGAANSASLLTATGGNATSNQTVVSGITNRMVSMFLKRVTGTGNIQLSMDNSTWTTVAVSNSWQRFSIPTQNIANPTIGVRIVTNGDAVAADYAQLESTKLVTSPVLTTVGSATRNADFLSANFPYHPQAMTVYAKYILEHVDAGADAVIVQIGSIATTNPRCRLETTGGTGVPRFVSVNLAGTSVISSTGSAPTNGQLVEVRGVLNSTGSVIVGQSIAGAAESVGSTSATQTLATSWNTAIIDIGGQGTSAGHAMGLMNTLILSGVRSLQDCRDLA